MEFKKGSLVFRTGLRSIYKIVMEGLSAHLESNEFNGCLASKGDDKIFAKVTTEKVNGGIFITSLVVTLTPVGHLISVKVFGVNGRLVEKTINDLEDTAGDLIEKLNMDQKKSSD